MSVLVVDDEVEICLLLSGILTKQGFDVTCHHTLAEARDSLKEGNYGLLFLDLNLPDGLGFRLIEDARTHNPHMKIIVISAYDSNIERKRADAEGVNYFLPKPFNRQMVWDAITRVDIPH